MPVTFKRHFKRFIGIKSQRFPDGITVSEKFLCRFFCNQHRGAIVQLDGSPDKREIKKIKKLWIRKMCLCFEGITLVCFHIESATVPSHRFLYSGKIIFRNLRQVFRTVTLQIIIARNFGQYAENVFPFLWKLLKLKLYR